MTNMATKPICGKNSLNLFFSGTKRPLAWDLVCSIGDMDPTRFAQMIRDQARGRLGRNSRPRGRNFALNGTQGEVGVSLKKKKKFHSVTTQMQAVVTLSNNLLLHRVSPSIKWQQYV